MRATSLYKSDICPHPTHCLPELLKRLTMVPRKGSWHPCKVVSEKNGSVRILIPDLECWFWSAMHAFLYAFVIFVIPWKGELSNGFCASFQLCQIWSGGDPSCFSFIHGNEHLSTVRYELATKISRLKVSACKNQILFMIFCQRTLIWFFLELKTPADSVCHQLSTTHWSDASTPLQFKSNFVVVNHFVLGLGWRISPYFTNLNFLAMVGLILFYIQIPVGLTWVHGWTWSRYGWEISRTFGNNLQMFCFVYRIIIPYPGNSKKQLA